MRLLLPLIYSGIASAHVAARQANNCLTNAGVPQNAPGTPEFTQAAQGWNRRVQYTPVAIAAPTTIAQVQAAVSCARAAGYKVNPKSGGHGYAAHAIGGENGHFIVDMKFMNDITVNPTTFAVTVGAGARLGNLALALFNNGQRAIAHGVCPGVGVGGHVLHGGQGLSTHTYGLALDFLTSAEVVLANSTVVTASATQNTDLFWALRGAGMSYGIVTKYVFRTMPAPPTNTLFYYPYHWTRAQAITAWTAWQNYCTSSTTPREMNIRIVVGKNWGSTLQFIVEGAYTGSQANFLIAIQPLLTQFNNIGGLVQGVSGTGPHELGWIDSLTYANNNGLFWNWNSGEQLATDINYNKYNYMYAKSLMTGNLSPAGVTAWVNKLYDTGPNNPRGWYFIVVAQGGPTSAVTTFDSTQSSYPHRNSVYEWQLVDQVSSLPYPTTESTNFVNDFITAIEAAEAQTFGMYYNYADPFITGGANGAGSRYFLGNYARLRLIKKAYDPTSLFANPQTVVPAP